MAISIISAQYKRGGEIAYYDCEILADAESDITALTDTITDGSLKIKAEPGSMAWTADMSAVYQLSPSKKWTKIGG